MSTVMIRVPDELKVRLEELKDQFYTKTTYEVIEKLIVETELQRKKIDELQKEIQAEKERKAEQDIYLGGERRKVLANLTNDLKLSSPADTVDFLIDNYEGLMNVPKLALLKYIELRK